MAFPSCLHCGSLTDLGYPMLLNKHLCHDCDSEVDTTFCGVCGVIGLPDDMVYASNGDGPHCPDCVPAVESEIIRAGQFDEDEDEIFGALDYNWRDPFMGWVKE